MFKVLVVDDTRLMRTILSRTLRELGIEPVEAVNGKEALARFEEDRPGLVLLDVSMPDMDGYDVAREIRARYPDEWVPIIFLSAREEAEDLRRGIEAGGDDYLIKPVDPVVLRAKIAAMRRIDDMRARLVAVSSELAQANEKLQKLSQLDGLTGIANRRTFDYVLERELGRCQRDHTTLSVILGDVDHFKLYNDAYGHPAGDQCLRAVAEALQSSCRRPVDLVARYGGEEFAIILPDTDSAGAITVAAMLNQAVAGLGLPHAASPTAPYVTMSLGVASLSGNTRIGAMALLEIVDQALYQAKRNGRNRFQVSTELAATVQLKVAA